MQCTVVSLIPHIKEQGWAERFASSEIFCSSNQSLLDEVGGGGRGYMAQRRMERNLYIFCGGVCRSESILKNSRRLKLNIKMGLKERGKFEGGLGFAF
jgi:hypothetical protein